MKVITFANHKGGCGKTTSALNLAVTLAHSGARVLAVDLDFQGNLSAALGASPVDLETNHLTSHRLLLAERADFSAYIFPARPRLALIPSCLDAEAEAGLEGAAVARELALTQRLQPARAHYDFCVVDTPPSLRVPTLNALALADLVVVPVESSMFALLGLAQLLRTIGRVKDTFAPGLIPMALTTIYSARQTIDRQIRQQVLERFGDNLVFQTTIPRLVAFSEAQARLGAVIEHSPESPGTFAFRKLAAEIKEVFDNEEAASRRDQRQSS